MNKLPWLIAALPLLAALHAGCGNTNGNANGQFDDAGDGGFGDGQTEDGQIIQDDGPNSAG